MWRPNFFEMVLNPFRMIPARRWRQRAFGRNLSKKTNREHERMPRRNLHVNVYALHIAADTSDYVPVNPKVQHLVDYSRSVDLYRAFFDLRSEERRVGKEC